MPDVVRPAGAGDSVRAFVRAAPDVPAGRSADGGFVVGAEDRAVPPDTSSRAARRIAGARVEVLPGLGHLMHEEAPEAAARLVRAFLARGLVAAQA